ncbi:hypothetical protein [Borrelia crocidurae]|uniref:Uncharacterized protein n=1 Tax=Borrelia crocidurae (strain Achema) TaxID=1155096 RepID=I0FE54_BORCA|nr:hypothetical protein [Borrelia crocidurae]AFI31760.1 hypothetical protein Q7M_1052 [Borrelia crocidurae str. Achema]
MFKVYSLIFILNILLLCCKQVSNDLINTSTPLAIKTNSINKRNLNKNKLQTSKLTKDTEYTTLIKSLNKFKELYNCMPTKFHDPLFFDINKKFNVTYNNRDHKNPIYSLVKGDTNTLHNLKKIIIKFNTPAEYDTSMIGDKLIDRLSLLAFNIIFNTIDINNGVFKNTNMLKLQYSKDEKSFKELAVMLDDVCVKWDMFVEQVKNIINEASNLNIKNNVIHKLIQFYDLDLNNPNQQCKYDDKLCNLKNEFLNSYLKTTNKIKSLI